MRVALRLFPLLLAAGLGALAVSALRDTHAASLPRRAHTGAEVARGRTLYLFTQDASGGSLTGPDDRHLTLTLRDVRPWVTRFTDRPERHAETVDIRDFLDRWRQRFATQPPNAVLSYRVPGVADPRDMVLVLRDPRYTAGTITYAATRIRRTTDGLPGTTHPLPPVVYPIPSSFESASLFIDDAVPIVPGCYWANAGYYSCDGVDLHGVDLSGWDLSDYNFEGTNFAGANLENTNWSYAQGSNVNFEGADLTNAFFKWTILSDSDFKGANLTNASLIDSYFDGTDMRGANLSGAEILYANLQGWQTDATTNLAGADFHCYVDADNHWIDCGPGEPPAWQDSSNDSGNGVGQ